MLQVKDLYVSYGQSEALHGVSFEAHKNETVAIMGRNGMGKTTLFKSLMGVLPSKAGEISVAGQRQAEGIEQIGRAIDDMDQMTQQNSALVEEASAAAESLAVFEGSYSFSTDTPDFWRREYQKYPEHGMRFTGEPAYFKHVSEAATHLMEAARLLGAPLRRRIVQVALPLARPAIAAGRRSARNPSTKARLARMRSIASSR